MNSNERQGSSSPKKLKDPNVRNGHYDTGGKLIGGYMKDTGLPFGSKLDRGNRGSTIKPGVPTSQGNPASGTTSQPPSTSTQPRQEAPPTTPQPTPPAPPTPQPPPAPAQSSPQKPALTLRPMRERNPEGFAIGDEAIRDADAESERTAIDRAPAGSQLLKEREAFHNELRDLATKGIAPGAEQWAKADALKISAKAFERTWDKLPGPRPTPDPAKPTPPQPYLEQADEGSDLLAQRQKFHNDLQKLAKKGGMFDDAHRKRAEDLQISPSAFDRTWARLPKRPMA